MSDFDLAQLVSTDLAEVTAYQPDTRPCPVILDANEAAPFLSKEARARLAQVTAEIPWERYPDAGATELRAALAERSGVTPGEIIVGVGSDEIIALLLTVLSRERGRGPATVVTTTPSFVMYRISARVRGMQVLEVPLDQDWDLPVPALIRAIEMSGPNLVFLASPNNPSGNLMNRERLEQVIVAAQGALVVVDEAYIDYSSRQQLDLFSKYPNVAVLRTLSKVGFAALRLGWVVARAEVVNELNKARLPYNISMVTQRLGTVVLREFAGEIAQGIRQVQEERGRLTAALRALPGVRVTPSDANFLWTHLDQPAGEAFEALIARGVRVRSFHPRGGRLSRSLRITVGTPEENSRLLQALGEVVGA